MAQTIKLKRSATAGAAPTTSQLELGEVAINTYDGKMYIKKSVGGTESIVEISGGGGASAADAIFEEYLYTATNNQTAFSGNDDNSSFLSYVSGAIQVFLNGVLLDPETDYTATNGATVTLTSGAATGDYLQIIAFKKKIGDGSVTIDTFSGNNSTTAFTLSLDPGDENNTRVFIDGVYQSKSNYTVSGTTLTFSSAPPSGTGIEVEIGNRAVSLDTTSSLDLPDNVKLRLGTGQDLQIYSDGTNSYIEERNTTSGLRITSDNQVAIRKHDNENIALFNVDGAVRLYHDNSQKFETTSTGVDVTGNIVVSGTVDGRDVAADGATAIAALPRTGGAMTGAITTNSTFDGRNVATDGAKLDGIESGATADQTQSEINALGITATGLSGTPAISVANITTTGELRGPASLVIDPAAVGDNTGTVVIKGNLQVDGATTTINSTTLTVDDLNITLASGAANGTAANGAGITVDGASATITYNSTGDSWDFNKGIDVTGTAAADAFTFDNYTLDSNKIATNQASGYNGDIFLDAAGDIILDADGGDVRLKDNGTEFLNFYAGTIERTGSLIFDVSGNITLNADGSTISLADGSLNFGQFYQNASGALNIYAPTQDKDIVFLGNDGGSTVTALTLDMSDSGAATFNSDILLSDSKAVRFGDQQDFRIYNDGNHTTFHNASTNHDIIFRGNDDGSAITALTLDMSNAGKATFNGIVSSAQGFERGNMFVTQNEIDVSSGSLTLDVADRIILDASTDGDVRLHDDGLFYGQLFQSSNNFYIRSRISDADIIFNGQDGSNFIDALTLDMSAAGYATFNSGIQATSGDFRNNSSGAETDALILRNYAAGANTATALKFFPTQSTTRFASIVAENVDGNNNIALSFLTSAGDTPTAALTLNQDRSATFAGTISSGATTISSSTSMLLTLNPTANNYGGILYQYGGATKGAAIYNSGMMNFGGEADVSTVLQAGGQYGLFIHHSTRNVGIGTGASAPGQKLTVAGGHIKLDEGYSLQWSDSHERIEQSDGHLEFFVNNGEKMTLDTNGLGIGTQNPTSVLHVSATPASGYPLAEISNTSNSTATSYGLSVQGGGNSSGAGYQFQTKDMSGNVDFFIRGNGEVGIGTTSPGWALDVRRSQSSVQFQLGRTTDSVGTTWMGSDSTGFHLGTGTYSSGGFSIASPALKVLTTSGNVGIGTTAPEKNLSIGSSQAEGIQFNFDTTNNYRNQILNYWNSSADSRMDFNVARASGATPSTIMSVGYNSNVGIGTTSPSHPLHILGTSNDTIDETKGNLKVQGSGGNGLIFGTIASSPYSSYIQSGYVQDTSIAQYNLALNPIGGSVGIGTTNPTFTTGSGLRIERASNATLRLQDTGNHGYEITATADDLTMRTMNNKPTRFKDSSGNTTLTITNETGALSVGGTYLTNNVFRTYLIGGPGSSAAFTRTVNVNTYWGFVAQGGIFYLGLHGWQTDIAVVAIQFHNNGSNTQVITGVSYHEMVSSQGISISVAKGSGDYDIDITITNAHSNTHGWVAKVWA